MVYVTVDWNNECVGLGFFFTSPFICELGFPNKVRIICHYVSYALDLE